MKNLSKCCQVAKILGKSRNIFQKKKKKYFFFIYKNQIAFSEKLAIRATNA